MLGSDELLRRLDLGGDDNKEGIFIFPKPAETGQDISGAASIDLRLGRWFLALQQTKTSRIDLGEDRESDEFEAREGKMHYVPFGQRFVVHPGRFVLATSLEWVRLPDGLGGHITGKSLIGRRGLVIETAAGIHPGFSGCIILELSNCGEVPIALVPGMSICQVFFHELIGKIGGPARTRFGGRRRPTFGRYVVDGLVKAALAPNPPGEGGQAELDLK